MRALRTGSASDSLIKGETRALRHTVCSIKVDDGGGGDAAAAAADDAWRRKRCEAPSAPGTRAPATRSICVRRKNGVRTWSVRHAVRVRHKRPPLPTPVDPGRALLSCRRHTLRASRRHNTSRTDRKPRDEDGGGARARARRHDRLWRRQPGHSSSAACVTQAQPHSVSPRACLA